MTNDLKNFLEEIERVFDTNLQLHDSIAYESLKSKVVNYHNNVLDLVEKEVEKTPVGYKVMSGELNDEDAPGYSQCRNDISTIINNLRI